MQSHRAGLRFLVAMVIAALLLGCDWLLPSSPSAAFVSARPPALVHRAHRSRLHRRGVEDTETMGDLFTKYYRLQEANQQLEADTKVKVVSEILEVLDDLERADSQLQADGSSVASSIRVIAGKLESNLRSLGFSRIQAVGKDFDPKVHEAVQSRPAADGFTSGQVCQEMRSGWQLQDRIVRPACVVVVE
mmetsp:Transcript_70948/g.132711  ORF Transcript_70948/g.132711 Transcript_70948/m.132711 type:complete len:190 (+) Transcript_70948:76-645(+)